MSGHRPFTFKSVGADRGGVPAAALNESLFACALKRNGRPLGAAPGFIGARPPVLPTRVLTIARKRKALTGEKSLRVPAPNLKTGHLRRSKRIGVPERPGGCDPIGLLNTDETGHQRILPSAPHPKQARTIGARKPLVCWDF